MMNYYPTGMGAGTGNHYHNVAAEMHAYLNNPVRRYSSPYQGQYYTGLTAASQALQYGAYRMGVDPIMVNEVGGLARSLMRNIIS